MTTLKQLYYVAVFSMLVGTATSTAAPTPLQISGHKSGSHILAQEKMPNLPGNSLTSMTIELKPSETSLALCRHSSW